MSLQSGLFKGDPRLEACLIQHPAHIKLGATGDHVRKIQMALSLLDGLQMDSGDLADKTYGPSTAAAVLAFKRKRNIVNWSYETQVDNIVGKMTIAALDEEMLQWEQNTTFTVESCACPRLQKHLPGMPA
jgi:peptidoglycan hydrolase-like protein with peptidoglycan-binding domain